MSAHTCKTLTPGCFRCDLNRDEVTAAFVEIETEALAAWRVYRDRCLSRGQSARQLRRREFIAGYCLANDYDWDA